MTNGDAKGYETKIRNYTLDYCITECRLNNICYNLLTVAIHGGGGGGLSQFQVLVQFLSKILSIK